MAIPSAYISEVKLKGTPLVSPPPPKKIYAIRCLNIADLLIVSIIIIVVVTAVAPAKGKTQTISMF